MDLQYIQKFVMIQYQCHAFILSALQFFVPSNFVTVATLSHLYSLWLWHNLLQSICQFFCGQNTIRQLKTTFFQFICQHSHLWHIQTQFLQLFHLGKNLFRSSLHGNSSLIHDKNLIGMNNFFHIMGNKNNRNFFYIIY